MTQLDHELEDALWHHEATGSDAGSDYDQEAAAELCAEELADGGPSNEEGVPDFEDLIVSLQGIPVEDAIAEVKDALKKAGRNPSDADLLAVLLKIFRFARDSAMEGYDTWDCPVGYCDELTRLCDRNFCGMGGGESSGPRDFSPNIVAFVYAECGRTLLLADDLQRARTFLQKAVNVFAVVPEDGIDEQTQRQFAAARASLARVARRLDKAEDAQVLYLRALELYAQLPAGDDTAAFLSEHCEVLGEAGAEALCPSTLGLLGDIAEEKFGTGSDEHLEVLKQVADACINADRIDLAAPALACRARVLQSEDSGLWSRSDARAAAEEAATALEAVLPRRLELGDLEGAIGVWQEAITFREFLEGPNSDIVSAMRNALDALVQASESRTNSTVAGTGSEGPLTECSLQTVDEERSEEAVPAPPVVDSWDDEPASSSSPEAFEPPPRRAAAEPPQPPPRVAQGFDLGDVGSLRPSWMKKPAPKPEPPSKAAEAADDAWDS